MNVKEAKEMAVPIKNKKMEEYRNKRWKKELGYFKLIEKAAKSGELSILVEAGISLEIEELLEQKCYKVFRSCYDTTIFWG